MSIAGHMRHCVWVMLAIVFPWIPAGAQGLPDAPSSRRVWDLQFWTVTVGNGAMVLSDAITTSALVGHTPACPREVWGETLYGRQANDGRVFAVMGAKYAASVGLSYVLKKYNVHIWHLKLWAATQVYNAYPHALGAAHNMRVCR
jgi:hypothetical protein